MKIWLGLILLGLGLAISEAAEQSPNVIEPQGANKLTQLKFLMDYTIFHIGAYITLSTLSHCSALKVSSSARWE